MVPWEKTITIRDFIRFYFVFWKLYIHIRNKCLFQFVLSDLIRRNSHCNSQGVFIFFWKNSFFVPRNILPRCNEDFWIPSNTSSTFIVVQTTNIQKKYLLPLEKKFLCFRNISIQWMFFFFQFGIIHWINLRWYKKIDTLKVIYFLLKKRIFCFS